MQQRSECNLALCAFYLQVLKSNANNTPTRTIHVLFRLSCALIEAIHISDCGLFLTTIPDGGLSRMLEAQGQRRANPNKRCIKNLSITEDHPVLYIPISIETRSPLTTLPPPPFLVVSILPSQSTSRDMPYRSDFTACRSPASSFPPTHHVSTTIPSVAGIGDSPKCNCFVPSFAYQNQLLPALPPHDQARHHVQLDAVPNPNQQQRRNQPDTTRHLLNNNLLPFILFYPSIPRRSTNPQPLNDR